jgi:capsular polysaccharide export protein
VQDQVAILSSGVWKIRGLVKQLTGFEPVRWMPPLKQPKFGCVVGWGLKSTSYKARELAKKHDRSYIAMEDGFIRSIVPGTRNIPISFVVDRSGIYYDASAPSDLDDLIVSSVKENAPETIKRARDGMRLLRENHISKYNHAPYLTPAELGLDPTPGKKRVLVVDQTYGDASVSYGMANAASFEDMLKAAVRENPEAEIIIKTHPEVISGRKKGYLSTPDNPRIRVIHHDVNPWSLIEAVEKVYVVTSQLGFEALLAGRKVICFGVPFYSGWGLTDDRAAPVRRKTARPSPEQLFSAVYINYARYVCPETKKEISFEEGVAWLIKKRKIYLA